VCSTRAAPETRQHPAVVKELAAGRFRLTIEASRTMPSCRNSLATLELAGPDRLAGKWDNGPALKLGRR
jgi:hypothetical protein